MKNNLNMPRTVGGNIFDGPTGSTKVVTCTGWVSALHGEFVELWQKIYNP